MTKDTGSQETAPQKERFGPYLKRAREAAGLSQEDLAREIRLSKELLENLESERFNKLPVEAYVRGYLNSICRRLELDRDKVLHWFHEEYTKTTGAPQQKPVFENLQNMEETETRSSRKTVPVIIIVLLAVFAIVGNYIRQQQMTGNDSNMAANPDPAAVTDTTTEDINHDMDSADSEGADTLQNADEAEEPEKQAEPEEETEEQQDEDSGEEKNVQNNSNQVHTYLKFRNTVDDSSWIRIFRHGPNRKTWTRELPKTKGWKRVSHDDTISVWLKSPSDWEFQVNGNGIEEQEEFQLLHGKVLQ